MRDVSGRLARRMGMTGMLARSLTYNLSSIVEDGIGRANHLFVDRVGLSVRELRVLRLVQATPGITFTALAQETKFDRSLTSRILSTLIKAGLIVRTNSGLDARVFTLALTQQGAALCATAEPMTRELEALMLQPLDAAEREAFEAMIRKVREWVQSGYASEVALHFPANGEKRAK
jgi:DNA-binding MarR family transcriptional regulator